MENARAATLVIIKRDHRILLGEKLTGEIGLGKLNGPGGKVIPGESLTACAVREAYEEFGIKIEEDDLELIGVLRCFVQEDHLMDVTVFWTDQYEGVPVTTESMRPQWVSRYHLPYDRMHDGDIHFFGHAVAKKHFEIRLTYMRPGDGLIDVEWIVRDV